MGTMAHPFAPDDVVDELRAARQSAWDRIVPDEFSDASVALLSDKLKHTILDWDEKPAGTNMVLFGEKGRGKTHIAWAILRSLFLSGKGVFGRSMFQLLKEMQHEFNAAETGDVFTRAATVDYLLLDDIGAYQDTEWAVSQLTGLLDWRYREQRASIVTTDLGLEDLREVLTGRVVSRLFAGDVTLIEATGPDLRRQQPPGQAPQ